MSPYPFRTHARPGKHGAVAALQCRLVAQQSHCTALHPTNVQTQVATAEIVVPLLCAITRDHVAKAISRTATPTNCCWQLKDTPPTTAPAGQRQYYCPGRAAGIQNPTSRTAARQSQTFISRPPKFQDNNRTTCQQVAACSLCNLSSQTGVVLIAFPPACNKGYAIPNIQ